MGWSLAATIFQFGLGLAALVAYVAIVDVMCGENTGTKMVFWAVPAVIAALAFVVFWVVPTIFAAVAYVFSLPPRFGIWGWLALAPLVSVGIMAAVPSRAWEWMERKAMPKRVALRVAAEAARIAAEAAAEAAEAAERAERAAREERRLQARQDEADRVRRIQYQLDIQKAVEEEQRRLKRQKNAEEAKAENERLKDEADPDTPMF